jgi:hypothetical protein
MSFEGLTAVKIIHTVLLPRKPTLTTLSMLLLFKEHSSVFVFQWYCIISIVEKAKEL